MPDNNTIAIDSAERNQAPINIDSLSSITNLTPDATSYRASNATFGLTNQTFFTKDDWTKAIQSGKEDDLRNAAAAQVNTGRINTAKQLVDQYGDKLPDGTLQTMLKYQNPSSVVEEHYAKSYMDYLNWPSGNTGYTPSPASIDFTTPTDKGKGVPSTGHPDSWAYWSQRDLPELWDWVKRAGGVSSATTQYLLTLGQNAQQETTWKDHVNAAIPDIFTVGGFGEYQMRTGVAKTPWYEGLGLGSNLRAQSENIWNIHNFDERRAEIDRIYNSLPQAYKAQWVQDMLYKSNSSVVADNLMTAANAAFGGKFALNFGRNIATPAIREAAWNRATMLTNMQTQIMNTRSRVENIVNAVTDMTKPRPTNVAPEVAAPAQAGNIPESAVNYVTIDAINSVYPNNNPLTPSLNRLSAIYDADGSLAASNPGRLGREAANRLQDMYKSYGTEFIETVFNYLLQRVDRTPTAAEKTVLAKIQKSLADLYRGPDNQVINVSNALWLPGLNTRLFNIAIGTNDAELFKSIEEAKAVARRNGWAVKGDYAVGPDERVNIIRKENLINAYRTQAVKATTPEGAANANKLADDLQAELDKIPRHQTGITVEGQFRPGQAYDAPIGPTRPTMSPGAPRKPAGALKSTEVTPTPPTTKPSVEPSNRAIWRSSGGDLPVEVTGSPVMHESTGSKKYYPVRDAKGNTTHVSEDDLFHHSTKPTDINPTKYAPESIGVEDAMSKALSGGESNSLLGQWKALREQQNKELVEGRVKRESKPLNVLERLDAELGRPATFEEWMEATKGELLPGETKEQRQALEEYIKSPPAYGSKEDAEARLKIGLPPSKAGVRTVKGKIPPSDMNSDEHPLQYYIRKKMEKEWAEGLETPEDMEKFYGLPASAIKQQGNGYYILHAISLPENSSFMRDGLLTSDLGELPKEEFRRKLAAGEVSTGIPNDWSGGFVSAITNRLGIAAPSEVMSIRETMNRNIATHGPAVLLGLIKKGLKPIAELSQNPLTAKKYWNDFNRLIRFGQNAWNEETKTPGKWFNTIADVDNWYQTVIGRQVTEPEVRAYFAFKALMLDDLNFRNLSVMTRKLAIGTKEHAVEYIDNYGATVITPYFEGVRLDRIPDNGRALYVNYSQPDKTKWGLIGRIMQNNPSLEQDIADGRAQIVHLLDPKSRPLRGIDRRPADYVISYKTQERPLGVNHVNRLEGGHLEPNWDYFLKQSDVDSTPHEGGRINVYNGEKTLLSFRSRAEARLAQEQLEPIRQKLAQLADVPLEKLSTDIQRWETEGGAISKFTESADDLHRSIYEEAAEMSQKTGIPFSKLAEIWLGENPAFNVHEPTVIVPKGQKVIDMGKEGAALQARYAEKNAFGRMENNLIDATKNGSLLGQIMTEFTQERDAEGLFTLRNTGTESRPYFAYEPADLVDPITSLERGYKNIVNSMFMYDMKQFSMEHWLEQAKDFLKNPETIRSNPLRHFYHPEYKDDITFTEKWRLEGNRRNALDFTGLKSVYDTGLTSLVQSMADSILGKGKIAVKPLNELANIKSFSNFMKQFAFYSYMTGFKSFFTQAATLGYIYAVGGAENGIKATAAMTMYGAYRANPAFLEQFDRALAQHFDWPIGRFSEAVRMLEGSGFGHIGQEHAFRQGEASLGLQSMSNVSSLGLGVKTTMRGGKALLDMSAIPFELGAASTRISGFFTAYLEHLAQAPGGVIDRQLQAAILNRASLLDINMSRAHNTRVQNMTLPSITTQLMSYDIRMAQLMWGKNLTVEEKQRLFAFSSMMYGMRGGGLALFGFPIAGATMEMLQRNGYVPGEDSTLDIAVNGWPSWYFAMLSGFADKDGKKTWIDSSSWGNRGVDLIDKFFDKDKTIMDWIMGASGNAFEDAWSNTWGLRQGLINKDYQITSDDWLQLMDTFGLTKDLHQGWTALQIGKMITSKGTNITDQSKFQTFLKTFFGLKPIQQADSFARQKVIGDYSAEIRQAQQHINQEMIRAHIDASNNDTTNSAIHGKNAIMLTLALIPAHQQKQAFETASRNVVETLSQRTNEKLNIQLRNDFETYRKLYNLD